MANIYNKSALIAMIEDHAEYDLQEIIKEIKKKTIEEYEQRIEEARKVYSIIKNIE